MSLIKNSAIVIVGVLITNIIGYVSNVYSARVLGPSSYGTLGALMAVFVLISMLIAPFMNIVTKYIARHKSENEKVVLFIRHTRNDILLFLLILMAFVFLSSGYLMKYLNVSSKFEILLTGFMVLANGMMLFNQAIFSGYKKFTFISLSKIFEALIRTGLIFVFILLGWGVIGIISAYSIGFISIFIWNSYYLPRTESVVNQKLQNFNRSDHYSVWFKFLVSGLFLQLILNFPSIYVQHNFSAQTNGYWNAGLNISRIALLFTDSVNQVIYPELVAENEFSKKMKSAWKGLGITILISGSSAMILFLKPDFIISIIYGNQYLKAVDYLKWQGLFIMSVSLIQLFFTFYFSKMFSKNTNDRL